MTDKKPTEAAGPDSGKSKLPPRAGDWHSGLKREDPDAYKATAPDTVSDFLTSQRGTESNDWDPIDEPAERKDYVGVFSGSSASDTDEPPDEPPVASRETMEFYHRRTRFSDLLIALVLAVVAFGAVFTTYLGIGHSWDEALYLKPAERAAAWMVGVFNSGDDLMLQRDAVDRHWGKYLDGQDPLHPEVAPVPKLLIGAGLTYLQPMFNLDPMVAMRVPNAILFGLTIALLYLLGTREYGRTGGFAAALFYALMPRVFGHAHIAASETPLAFFTVLTVYCFLIANRFWPFALFTGIAFGLAVATKISALMLPLPLMLWGQVYRRRDYASNVFAMAFVAPIVALAVWPWLWYEGLKRFFAYLIFYVDHQKTAVYYMGRIWGYTRGPVAPFYYPPHIAFVVVPLWILVFLVFGLLRALLSTVRRPVTLLFVLMAVAWIGLSMLPGAPRYDGERLFFPAFAFLALVAAGGFSMLFVGIGRWRDRRGHANARREGGFLAAIALVLLTVYGTADIFFTHPNELNYYNWSVGRPQGAYQLGFETSYWGEAVNEDVTEYLNQTLKPGDKVKTLALNELAFENLRRWGKLPEKVDFSPDEPPYDYVIMQVRQGFMGQTERRIFRSKKPLQTFSAQGVPRILVYAGAEVGDVFPPLVEAEDGRTSGTVFDLSGTPSAADNITTPPGAASSETTPSLTAFDAGTTESAGTTGTLETTPTVVLDLVTSEPEPASIVPTTATETLSADAMTTDLATETTATEMDIQTTTGQVFDALVPGDPETSATHIYEGDLPSTAPVELEMPSQE